MTSFLECFSLPLDLLTILLRQFVKVIVIYIELAEKTISKCFRLKKKLDMTKLHQVLDPFRIKLLRIKVLVYFSPNLS